jgi:hypothetical protein
LFICLLAKLSNLFFFILFISKNYFINQHFEAITIYPCPSKAYEPLATKNTDFAGTSVKISPLSGKVMVVWPSKMIPIEFESI